MAMGIQPGVLSLAMVLAAAVALAGCGGSGSSSAERTKLESQLSAQTKTSAIPADLAPCVIQQAGKLPIAQLRAVAGAGANPSPATQRVALGLVTACIRQGKGLSALHTLIIQSITSATPANVPPAFKQCLIEKANATTASQLSQLVSAYADQNPATAQPEARQVGMELGRQCLNEPRIITALRGLLIVPIKSAFQKSSYSAAFKDCILKKSEQFPASKLREAALNPAGASALGQAFGANAARECIASGAKP